MAPKPAKDLRLTCQCGGVEYRVSGPPILGAVCHCDDCREAAVQLGRLSGADPLRDTEGGTPCILFRKDQVTCLKGQERLRDHRLDPGSPTRRVIASCCDTPMFLDYEKGHWFSVYRARLGRDAPPVQMRIQTGGTSRRPAGPLPSYPGYPPVFMLKLTLARLAMMIGR
ncbi:GFA family protein [Phenylobacterium sp.]|uniref:GFA family protein n=1 Tax=Phenylobacterium sp. TaxID=1871053 RepID=UPI00271AAD24|nr:DUF6151 family protein [Phenylobacterium sp.]MDO8380327.1 DUF6151 family protein [Phenylobacterium sp.]